MGLVRSMSTSETPAESETPPSVVRERETDWSAPSALSNTDAGQPPPHLAPGGVPCCPRHGDRLIDDGPQPAAVPMAARVGGVVRERFVVTEGRPVVVGRSPDDRDGVVLGPYLDDRAVR